LSLQDLARLAHLTLRISRGAALRAVGWMRLFDGGLEMV
jgi:hypothetical protein